MNGPAAVENRTGRARVSAMSARDGALQIEIVSAGESISRTIRRADEPGLEILTDLDRSLIRSALLTLARSAGHA